MSRILGSPARLLARFVGTVLLIGLSLLGLAIAIFCIQGGSAALSPARLAEHLSLPGLRDSAFDLLNAVESDGPLAAFSALAGIGAIFAAGLLLLGLLSRRSERLFELEDSPEGRIAARPSPLGEAAAETTRHLDGVTDAKASARASHSGGLVSITAVHRGQENDELEARVDSAVAGLRSSFGLKTKVRTVQGGKGSRVE